MIPPDLASFVRLYKHCVRGRKVFSRYALPGTVPVRVFQPDTSDTGRFASIGSTATIYFHCMMRPSPEELAQIQSLAQDCADALSVTCTISEPSSTHGSGQRTCKFVFPQRTTEVPASYQTLVSEQFKAFVSGVRSLDCYKKHWQLVAPRFKVKAAAVPATFYDPMGDDTGPVAMWVQQGANSGTHGMLGVRGGWMHYNTNTGFVAAVTVEQTTTLCYVYLEIGYTHSQIPTIEFGWVKCCGKRDQKFENIFCKAIEDEVAGANMLEFRYETNCKLGFQWESCIIRTEAELLDRGAAAAGLMVPLQLRCIHAQADTPYQAYNRVMQASIGCTSDTKIMTAEWSKSSKERKIKPWQSTVPDHINKKFQLPSDEVFIAAPTILTSTPNTLNMWDHAGIKINEKGSLRYKIDKLTNETTARDNATAARMRRHTDDMLFKSRLLLAYELYNAWEMVCSKDTDQDLRAQCTLHLRDWYESSTEHTSQVMDTTRKLVEHLVCLLAVGK